MENTKRLLGLGLVGVVGLAGMIFGLSSCTHATGEEDDVSKSRAAELMAGGADVDYCAENGWYGDGVCDDFCEKDDPDCSDSNDGKADDPKGGDDYEPCADKACGATCTVCAPGDSDCVETAVVKYCQPDGSCSADKPTCDGGSDDYDPCADKACGARCTKCPPNDSDCAETDVLKYCQPDGTCSAGNGKPACDGGSEPPEDYDPCADKTCGAECTVCPPGDSDCVESAEIKYCQPDGSCSGGEPTCDGGSGEYDPCADKACGERCQVCAPGDSDCVESAVLKYCQPDGSCGSSQPTCN